MPNALTENSNVLDGMLSFEVTDFVSQETYEQLSKRVKLKAGDVLLSCSGTVGRSCVLKDDFDLAFVRSVAIIKPVFSMGDFISYALRSPHGQDQINRSKTQTAQANIFQGKIKQLVIPLAPEVEQRVVVDLLDQSTASQTRVKEFAEKRQDQLALLDVKVLERAFSGELVATEAELARQEGREYEPASVLLERIKAEREERAKVKKSEKRPKMVKTSKKGELPSRKPLVAVLVANKKAMTPEQLFSEAGYTDETIDDFYEALRAAVKAGSISQKRPNRKDVFLEAVTA